MHVVIPTYRRASMKLATTLVHWPKMLSVTLAVRGEEADAYKRLIETVKHPFADILVLPSSVHDIATTRQAILEHYYGATVMMLDDDLRFYVRDREDNPLYLSYAGNSHITSMLAAVKEDLASGAVHVAISMREGNNRVEAPFVLCTRGIRAVAYDTKRTLDAGCSFRSEVSGREDFDMTLQLLRKGHPNKVWYAWAQGQSGSNTIGGLAGVRNAESLTASANRLAELHPGIVRVVEKQTKADWGVGGTRTDVVVGWKKAYESSMGSAPDAGVVR